MKKLLVIPLFLILFSCAPVLNRDLMEEAMRNVPLSQIRANPGTYKGKLFVLGGVIVETRLTEKGSLLEVLALPVDSGGRIEDTERAMGRFLALYPAEKGILDPMVYKKGRYVTLAGDFVENRTKKIDELEYVYPLFQARQVHLWEEERAYAGYPYSYYPYSYYPYPYWYHPYWSPWPPPPGWW